MLKRYATVLVLSAMFGASTTLSQGVPTPESHFGYTLGDDYKIADYGEITSYLKKLDEASDRVQMVEIGRSVLDKPLYVLFISSAENLNQLDTWKGTAEKLARAKIAPEEAARLSQSGKAMVWLDAGLHATERATSQMAPLLAHKMATEGSAEMNSIRENVVLMLMPCMNPDGLDIVADWYKRNLGTAYETTGPPWLYHHYVGHDNNRDWFMNNMPESEAVTEFIYNNWYPQIVYNHHQTSPAWARIFLPPFSDPVNPNIHPGVTTSVNMVGTAMANRFAMERKPGVVSDVIFSMWWNGGMRTVPYFHNMIGILTETAHSTPTPRTYDASLKPKSIAARRGSGTPTNGTDIFYPLPWEGGESHFADAVDYMMTASMAVVRYAADRRVQLLTNIYEMGRDAIEAAEADGPFAYVVSTDQRDWDEAVALVNVLRVGGIEIQRATRGFSAGSRDFPAGSYVIPGAQAFRPYIEDLLGVQQYPDRRAPGGQPETPYDLAGWTLPMQMGVKVDEVNDSFSFRSEPVENPQTSGVSDRSIDASAIGIDRKANSAWKAVARLQAAGLEVSATNETFQVAGSSDASEVLSDLSGETALPLVADPDDSEAKPIGPVRVGLYKSWSASMDEGWTRWLLEDYGLPVDTLHDADVIGADLSNYSAIVLPHQTKARILHGHAFGTMPDEFVGGLGLDGTLALKKYVEQGGTLIALDAASDYVIDQFGLPVRNAVEGMPASRFFIPGSLVRLEVDTSHSLAAGMPDSAAAYFVRSRAFELVQLDRMGEGGQEDTPLGPTPNVSVVARYAESDILMSGWALGEDEAIGGKPAMVCAPMGDGNVVLFAFRPQFRGQPRGTYKLFFNALLKAENHDCSAN